MDGREGQYEVENTEMKRETEKKQRMRKKRPAYQTHYGRR